MLNVNGQQPNDKKERKVVYIFISVKLILSSILTAGSEFGANMEYQVIRFEIRARLKSTMQISLPGGQVLHWIWIRIRLRFIAVWDSYEARKMSYVAKIKLNIIVKL